MYRTTTIINLLAAAALASFLGFVVGGWYVVSIVIGLAIVDNIILPALEAARYIKHPEQMDADFDSFRQIVLKVRSYL